jgi:hypothetical protein
MSGGFTVWGGEDEDEQVKSWRSWEARRRQQRVTGRKAGLECEASVLARCLNGAAATRGMGRLLVVSFPQGMAYPVPLALALDLAIGGTRYRGGMWLTLLLNPSGFG